VRVLITGGAGFIGSHTADLLLERGYQVRVLDSLEPPVHQRREKPTYVASEAEFIVGDVRDRSDMEKALRGEEVVFHLAAYQKVILASSQAVYGEGRYECREHGVQYPPPRPVEQLARRDWEVECPLCGEQMLPVPTDESRVNPHNQYAVSKYAQELYALTLGRRYGIPTVALRYSITQGPRQSFHNAYSGVLRSFTIRLLNNLSPVIYEDGRQLRDYVYVGDVARANLLALQTDAVDYQAFNVGGSKATSVLEYAWLLMQLTGEHVEPEIPGEFRLGDTRHIISDISKLRSLGWEPLIPLEGIAQEYIAWAEAQPEVLDYYAQAAQVMKEKSVIRAAG